MVDNQCMQPDTRSRFRMVGGFCGATGRGATKSMTLWLNALFCHEFCRTKTSNKPNKILSMADFWRIIPCVRHIDVVDYQIIVYNEI